VSDVPSRMDEPCRQQARASQGREVAQPRDAPTDTVVPVAVDAAALGELLTELARLCHRINNPLTAIMGRAQILRLKRGSADDEKLNRSVEVIEESAKRVAELVQQMANRVCQGRKEFLEHYDSSSGSR